MRLNLAFVRILLLTMSACIFPGISSALQTAPQSAAAAEAERLYLANDWTKAGPAYEALTKENPSNSQAWYRWGVSLAGLGQYPKAIECYDKAESLGFHKFSVLYRKAKAYARLGDKEKAFAMIDAIFASGQAPSGMDSDSDLLLLKDDPRFAKDVEKADAAARPCAHQAEYQQFDFWVGEWEVKQTGANQVVGASSIQKILGECVVLENWTSGSGSTGKSFNVYDAATKKWEQYWVASVGGRIHFIGGLKDGNMDYFANTDDGAGNKSTRHLQFIHEGPDQVRQWSQRSIDGGKTWSTEYDFTYFRRKTPS
jgi:tetratricopeptide (TPR) repeat protein